MNIIIQSIYGLPLTDEVQGYIRETMGKHPNDLGFEVQCCDNGNDTGYIGVQISYFDVNEPHYLYAQDHTPTNGQIERAMDKINKLPEELRDFMLRSNTIGVYLVGSA